MGLIPVQISLSRLRKLQCDLGVAIRHIVLRATRDQVIVRAGLADGERVVVSALDVVSEGMLVRVAADAPAPAGVVEAGQ